MTFDLTSDTPQTVSDLSPDEKIFIRCTCGHARETVAGALRVSNLDFLEVAALPDFFICGNSPCGGDITVSRSGLN